MDRFRAMESFIAVVEAGSFVGAADLLRVTKAAVSRGVMELEARLGARLLQRTTRRLSLTEAGRAYYGRCKQILAEVEEADSAVGVVTGHPVGRLRINAPFSFGILHLAPLWGPFMERYPDVELEVTLADRMVDVVEEGFDVIVRISRLEDSSLVYRRLASTRILACASPEYLARNGSPASVEDLARHPVIAYTYAAQGDQWRFSTPDGEREVLTRPRMRTNNGDTCRAVALAHQGIVLQPDFLVSDDIAAGRLVEVLPDCRGPEIGIFAVYPSRKHLSVKVRALVDFLVDAFAAPRGWGRAGDV
ncbi:MAG: LysR family transcriptional regulator [Proteobacteria bacterium]|nr:LysR family transcriptional regulator [Pseudomonadota bacterium]MBS0554327.1 LysR family transcriptional regulator [Pseudomonadota bacterium]